MNPDVDQALRAARFFRRLGYQPLPSKAHVKGPDLDTYADYWETPLPESVYASWRARNLQLMTGVRWRLAVVDLDGPESPAVWDAMQAALGPAPATWTARTGSGGRHLYFALPAWLDECPSRRLWGLWDTWGGPHHRGDWRKHQEVRLLADRALVIAPPSIHVDSGLPYAFLPGLGPRDFARPAPIPDWVLTRPAAEPPRAADPGHPIRLHDPDRPRPAAGVERDRAAVLADLGPRKHEIAAGYGLRLAAAGPNPKGWVACHAIGRDDRTPSASIHHDTGVYHDRRDDVRLSFFDLLSALAPGTFPDWRAAVNALGGGGPTRRAG